MINFDSSVGSIQKSLLDCQNYLALHHKLDEELTLLFKFGESSVYALPIIDEYEIDRQGRISGYSSVLAQMIGDFQSENNFVFFNLMSGNYRIVHFYLRCYLELILVYCYYFIDDKTDQFNDWLEGKCNTPSVKQIKEKFQISLPGIKKLKNYVNSADLLKDDLDNIVHRKGKQTFHWSIQSSSGYNFVENSFKNTFKEIKDTFEIAYTTLTVINPILILDFDFSSKLGPHFMMGRFSENKVSKRNAIIRSEWLSVLEELCKQDKVKKLEEYLIGLPDFDENNPNLQMIYNQVVKMIQDIVTNQISTES